MLHKNTISKLGDPFNNELALKQMKGKGAAFKVAWDECILLIGWVENQWTEPTSARHEKTELEKTSQPTEGPSGSGINHIVENQGKEPAASALVLPRHEKTPDKNVDLLESMKLCSVKLLKLKIKNNQVVNDANPPTAPAQRTEGPSGINHIAIPPVQRVIRRPVSKLPRHGRITRASAKATKANTTD